MQKIDTLGTSNKKIATTLGLSAVAAEAAHGRRDGLLIQGVLSSNTQTTRIHRTAVLVLMLTHGARADNTQTMQIHRKATPEMLLAQGAS